MMSIEGPFLSAVIARLSEPKQNLAAYGVAYAFALFLEAPVIMVMSAATALVKDRASFLKIRRFVYALNGMMTAFMLICLIPPVYDFLIRDLMQLPPKIADLTYITLALLLPWPAAIGYRRFYQGVLIRSHMTRRVAYGTIVRLSSMVGGAVALHFFTDLPGAAIGGAALSIGVLCEAAASRKMAAKPVVELLQSTEIAASHDLTYRKITKFYFPLAVTSILAMGVHPFVSFFLGQSKDALDSLAALPVMLALVFIFRTFGLAFQEVGIALMDERFENYPILRNFAIRLGVFATAALMLIAFTPLARLWYETVSGLPYELSIFTQPPTQIMAVIPALSVLLAFQRAMLMNAGKTEPITVATIFEVGGILLTLYITIFLLNMSGIIAAALALIAGRASANAWLVAPYFQALKRIRTLSVAQHAESV